MDRSEQMAPGRAEAVDDARRKLGRRLVLAGILIVILLGALAVFDHLAKMEPAEVQEPPSVAKIEPAPQVGPAIHTDGSYPVGAPPPPPIQETVAGPSPAPAPAPDLPPKPEVAAHPSVQPPPAPPPVRIGSGAMVRPLPAGVPEETSSRPMLAAPPTPAKPVQTLLKRGYVLQAGVFSSADRAEELKARLEAVGVPVSIESRVRVGPFATPKEANEARAKIKALGIESILIPPRGAGR